MSINNTNSIPFTVPYLCGVEVQYIQQALSQSKQAGDGPFSKKSEQWFEKRFGFRKALLSPSCTASLEMVSLLAGIGPGDEVIIPSYTFVTSASAFAMRGAKIKFCDSRRDHPNVDTEKMAGLITHKTKAVVIVHYAGFSVDFKPLLEAQKNFNFLIIEDAAHSFDAYYFDRPLGGIGELATFSFHETKNIQCGEGGLTVINEPALVAKAEIVREKGTNRLQFFRGEVDKYGWVELGSSYLTNEISAAYLLAQLEDSEKIQKRRVEIFRRYWSGLQPLAQQGFIELPKIESYMTINGHLFFFSLPSLEIRTSLKDRLFSEGIQTTFHYQALHNSPYYLKNNPKEDLPHATKFTDCLLRLPLFVGLADEQVDRVVESIGAYFKSKK